MNGKIMRCGYLWTGLALGGMLGAATVEKVGGGGTNPPGGPVNETSIDKPMGIAFDKAGNYYLPEWQRNRIIKVDTRGITSIFAGTGAKGFSGDGGPALQASFGLPHDTVIANEVLYFADTANAAVRAIDLKTGIISSVAGTGVKGYSGDGGPAKEAQFTFVVGVSLSPDNKRLYVADMMGGRVRVVNLVTGIVTPVAGNGKVGVPTEGAPAVGNPLNHPRGVREDAQGNIYILEQDGNALRVIKKDGRLYTILGPGIEPALVQPKELVIDKKGDLIMVDGHNHTIRKYSPATGKTTSILGTGEPGDRLVPGDPLQTQLKQPHFLYIEPTTGDIFVTDTFNDRILRLKP
jgi:DNA-binding beta-propeller fold protein YncE